jgi:hypothetical protein
LPLDPKWFWPDWQIQPSLLLSVEVGPLNPHSPDSVLNFGAAFAIQI